MFSSISPYLPREGPETLPIRPYLDNRLCIVTYLPREGPGINDDGINSYISYFCKEIARFEVFRNSIEPQTRMFEGELALPIHLARGRKLSPFQVT